LHFKLFISPSFSFKDIALKLKKSHLFSYQNSICHLKYSLFEHVKPVNILITLVSLARSSAQLLQQLMRLQYFWNQVFPLSVMLRKLSHLEKSLISWVLLGCLDFYPPLLLHQAPFEWLNQVQFYNSILALLLHRWELEWIRRHTLDHFHWLQSQSPLIFLLLRESSQQF